MNSAWVGLYNKWCRISHFVFRPQSHYCRPFSLPVFKHVAAENLFLRFLKFSYKLSRNTSNYLSPSGLKSKILTHLFCLPMPSCSNWLPNRLKHSHRIWRMELFNFIASPFIFVLAPAVWSQTSFWLDDQCSVSLCI